MRLKSKENTAQGAYLGIGSFRRPTTGCLYNWEEIKHSCPEVPSDSNERTLYLAKKEKSTLKNIVSGFESLLHAYIAIW